MWKKALELPHYSTFYIAALFWQILQRNRTIRLKKTMI